MPDPVPLDLSGPSWGALHVFPDAHLEGDPLPYVRGAVIEAYQTQGLWLRGWVRAEEAIERYALGPAAPLTKQEAWGPDEVYLLPEPKRPWVAVMSFAFEWCAAGRHPLALALSRHFPVLSTTLIEERYAEYALYRDGQLSGLSLVGPQPPQAPAAPELDLDWLEQRGAAVAAAELRRYLPAPWSFTSLAGPDLRGARDTLEGAPLSDFTPDEFLIFRPA